VDRGHLQQSYHTNENYNSGFALVLLYLQNWMLTRKDCNILQKIFALIRSDKLAIKGMRYWGVQENVA